MFGDYIHGAVPAGHLPAHHHHGFFQYHPVAQVCLGPHDYGYVAELVLQCKKHCLAQGPLAADYQTGHGNFFTIAPVRNLATPMNQNFNRKFRIDFPLWLR